MTRSLRRDHMMSLIASVALFLPSCRSGDTPMSRPLVIGHRGASHVAPENTLASFRRAFSEGADGVEGDFRSTRDGVIVCLHDADLKRTTGDDRSIASVDVAALRDLDAGSWKGDDFRDEGVPTLIDVVGVVPSDRDLLVELKSGVETVQPLLLALSKSSIAPDRCTIISFDDDVVRSVRTDAPEYGGYLLDSFKRDGSGGLKPTVEELIDRARANSATGIGVQANLDVIDETFMAACRSAGLEVNVWTVNDPDTAVVLMELGVTSITTDRPGLIRDALKAAASGDD